MVALNCAATRFLSLAKALKVIEAHIKLSSVIEKCCPEEKCHTGRKHNCQLGTITAKCSQWQVNANHTLPPLATAQVPRQTARPVSGQRGQFSNDRDRDGVPPCRHKQGNTKRLRPVFLMASIIKWPHFLFIVFYGKQQEQPPREEEPCFDSFASVCLAGSPPRRTHIAICHLI